MGGASGAVGAGAGLGASESIALPPGGQRTLSASASIPSRAKGSIHPPWSPRPDSNRRSSPTGPPNGVGLA